MPSRTTIDSIEFMPGEIYFRKLKIQNTDFEHPPDLEMLEPLNPEPLNL